MLIFCLFGKQLLKWIPRLLWKQPSMTQWLCWCLLRDAIKIKKVLFVGMLNIAVYLINCCWHESQGFCGSIYLWAYHVHAHCVITSSEQKNLLSFERCLCLFDKLLLTCFSKWRIFVFPAPDTFLHSPGTWLPVPICIEDASFLFVFTGPGPQFLSTSPQPSVCICQPQIYIWPSRSPICIYWHLVLNLYLPALSN